MMVDPLKKTKIDKQMIYYVECIPAGTWLLQQLYSKYSLDQLELGCLFDGLSTFIRQPTIGGRSAAGYGQVHIQIQGSVGTEPVQLNGDWSETIKDALVVYQNYLTEKRDYILEVLTAQTVEINE